MTPLYAETVELLERIIADLNHRGRPWALIDSIEHARNICQREGEPTP